jgi:hypothetical protein
VHRGPDHVDRARGQHGAVHGDDRFEHRGPGGPGTPQVGRGDGRPGEDDGPGRVGRRHEADPRLDEQGQQPPHGGSDVVEVDGSLARDVAVAAAAEVRGVQLQQRLPLLGVGDRPAVAGESVLELAPGGPGAHPVTLLALHHRPEQQPALRVRSAGLQAAVAAAGHPGRDDELQLQAERGASRLAGGGLGGRADEVTDAVLPALPGRSLARGASVAGGSAAAVRAASSTATACLQSAPTGQEQRAVQRRGLPGRAENGVTSVEYTVVPLPWTSPSTAPPPVPLIRRTRPTRAYSEPRRKVSSPTTVRTAASSIASVQGSGITDQATDPCGRPRPRAAGCPRRPPAGGCPGAGGRRGERARLAAGRLVARPGRRDGAAAGPARRCRSRRRGGRRRGTGRGSGGRPRPRRR